LVLTKEAESPFSFFNLIFINNQISGEDAKTILTHEQVHVRQRHSIDVILMEIVVILQWFNPIVWFYRISVREVHEYLADRTTLHRGIEKADYLQLLFAMALNVKPADVTNNFCQTKLKRRLTMITKNHHAGFSAFKFALILPALALFIWLVSCNKSTKDSNGSENILVEKTTAVTPDSVPTPPPPPPPPTSDIAPPSPPTNSSNDKVYKIVEEMPSYPGGDEARIKFLVDNFVYPTSAKEKGIQGTVYITFVVGADGTVSNVKVLRGIGGGCDEEAVRIVKMMPKWIPGKQDGKNVSVIYNLPIKFKLQ
jgi:TonB family protein